MAKQRADAAVARAIAAVSPWGVRVGCASLVGAAGLAGVLVPALRLFGTPGGISGPTIGALVPALFGVAVLYGGVWIATSPIDGRLAVTVVVWWFLGTAFGAFAALGLMGYQLAAGLGVADVAIVITGMASLGGAGGLLVGRYDARGQRRHHELQRERERLTDEREKLALLNRIVRHDIGNDLQIVAGMTDHLEAHVDSDGQEYLERLQRTTEEAIQLTEQVRAFVASLGEGVSSERRRISLARVLRTQVENTREIHREATVSLEGEIPAVAVYADELLSTVFHNLLTNAIEHNDRENPYVEVSAERSGEAITVRILDDGPGIPGADRQRLHSVAAGGDRQPGSGLGLYIVGMLVDRYDGTVSVGDRESRGSIVTVTLPLADGE